MGLAVLSHWFFDLIVHTPDLPIWHDASMKLGFGLWNNAIAAFTLEAVLLIAALTIYLRSTSASAVIGQYGMGIFVAILVLINAINVFAPLAHDSQVAFVVTALTLYFLFASTAHWLDGKRL